MSRPELKQIRHRLFRKARLAITASTVKMASVVYEREIGFGAMDQVTQIRQYIELRTCNGRYLILENIELPQAKKVLFPENNK